MGLIDRFYNDYCCAVPSLSNEPFEEWFSMEDALQFVQNVQQGNYAAGGIDAKRVNTYAKAFNQAVDKGWTKAGASLDFDSPDVEMLNALRNNVFHFAAAKNRAEIEQLSALLIDKDGKSRSFASFKQEALKITDAYETRYLKVEYDHAINSSYLAARWKEFAEDDIIVFRTAGDARVRDSHKKLDGTALPKTHPFWNTFMPPLSWNCRCTVEVSQRSTGTAEDKIPYGEIDNVPPMFRSNFANEGMAFPPNHPYFKEPIQLNKELLSWSDAAYKNWGERADKNGQVYETDLRYKPTKSLRELARKEKDWQNRKTAAEAIAHHFDTEVFLPPTFRTNRDWRYNYFYDKLPIAGKMPDLRFNNEWWEMESYEGAFDLNKLSNMITHGKKQSPNVIIKMNHDYNIASKEFLGRIEGYLKAKQNVGTVDKIFIIDSTGSLHKVL